jgi:hypothetical protein
MRLIFGALSLLIVLAIIGTVGKKQFEALGAGVRGERATVAVPGGVSGAAPAPADGNLPAQSRAIQNNVRDAAANALQQGADRPAASNP